MSHQRRYGCSKWGVEVEVGTWKRKQLQGEVSNILSMYLNRTYVKELGYQVHFVKKKNENNQQKRRDDEYFMVEVLN